VFETTRLYGELGKFRCLQFADDAVQGAIDLKNPKRIVLEYQNAIIQLMTLINSEFDRAFVIGHGIGTIAGYYADKKIKVAEIDSKVVELSRRLFDYRLDNVVVGDGRDILKDERSDSYDYLVVDAFTPKGTPLRLTTLAFFEMTIEKLNSNGTLLMNVFGKPNNDRLINAIYTTLREIYPCAKVYSLPAKDDSEVRNMILIASKKPIVLPGKIKAGLSEIELDDGHLLLDNDRGVLDRK
jgi:spermidine synthase